MGQSNLQHYYEASQLGLQPILDEFGPMYYKGLINDFARSHANNYCLDEPSAYNKNANARTSHCMQKGGGLEYKNGRNKITAIACPARVRAVSANFLRAVSANFRSKKINKKTLKNNKK